MCRVTQFPTTRALEREGNNFLSKTNRGQPLRNTKKVPLQNVFEFWLPDQYKLMQPAQIKNSAVLHEAIPVPMLDVALRRQEGRPARNSTAPPELGRAERQSPTRRNCVVQHLLTQNGNTSRLFVGVAGHVHTGTSGPRPPDKRHAVERLSAIWAFMNSNALMRTSSFVVRLTGALVA